MVFKIRGSSASDFAPKTLINALCNNCWKAGRSHIQIMRCHASCNRSKAYTEHVTIRKEFFCQTSNAETVITFKEVFDESSSTPLISIHIFVSDSSELVFIGSQGKLGLGTVDHS